MTRWRSYDRARRLSPQMEHVLRQGDGDSDRSQTMFRVILAMIRAGWSADQAWQALMDNPGGAGEHLRTAWVRPAPGMSKVLRKRRPRQAMQDFEHSWAKAVRFVNNSEPFRDRGDVAMAIFAYQQVIEAMSRAGAFRERAGATDLAVVQALVAEANRLLRLELKLSVRRLGELARVEKSTVSRSVRRLVDRGLISRTRKPGTAQPMTLRLLEHAKPTGQEVLTHQGVSSCPGDFASDVFRWGGLGLKAGQAYRLLDAEPLPSWVVGTELGVGVRQAESLLAKLKQHDLAELGPDGWVRGSRDLMEVAMELDVAGTTLAQYLQHRVERHEFRRDRARRNAQMTPYAEPIRDEQTGELLAVEWLDPDTRSLHAVPNSPFFTDADRVHRRRLAIARLVAVTWAGATTDWESDGRTTAAGDRAREADRARS